MGTFIINDINVANCEYRKQGFCNCSGHEIVDENGALNTKALTFGIYCRENPNCYFKQLQRIKKILKDFFEEWEKDDEYWDKKMKEAQNADTTP